MSLGNPALTLLNSNGDREIPNDTDPTTTPNPEDAQQVRINIVNMDKGEVLELTYKDVWAAAVTTAPLATVTVFSDEGTGTCVNLGWIGDS